MRGTPGKRFFRNWNWENITAPSKKVKVDPYIKINSKLIKDLNKELELTKPLKEKHRGKTFMIMILKGFCGHDTKSTGKKKKIKSFLYIKENY